MIQLRDYQETAVNAIFDFFASGAEGNPLVAMPTGTGKSLVIGGFIQRVMSRWPNVRILMLTHVKELIVQNARALKRIWSEAPIGIHSAGLKERDVHMPIIFGGIQSIKAYAKALGWIDLLFIDEAHLLSPNGNTMYRKFIDELRAVNPNLRVIGLTATPWRSRQGLLIESITNADNIVVPPLFTNIVFDATTIDWFDWFIRSGYLVTPIPKRMQTTLDVSGVGVQNGEYKVGELQNAVDKEEVNYAALRELCHYGADRRSWLLFASGVDHAEHLAAGLAYFGVPAAAVHSKITTEERNTRLQAFERQELRALVNNNVLTTGYDYPPIDLIGMLRPTQSTGLWVQMIGRGMRPSIETRKSNCLVLDFAGNTPRLGPINDPVIPRKGVSGGGDAPVKICPECDVYNHARVRFCVNCGHEFDLTVSISKSAGTEELLKSDAPIFEDFAVNRVFYDKHTKLDHNKNPAGPPVIRVRYVCGLKQYNEWVCLEHPGFPGRKARDWWHQRHVNDPPATIDQALSYISELRVPRSIRVWVNNTFPEVVSVQF